MAGKISKNNADLTGVADAHEPQSPALNVLRMKRGKG